MAGFTDEETGAEREPLVAGDGRVELDPDQQLVIVDGEVVESIVGRKLELLRLLLGKQGGLLPKAVICEEIWGEDSVSARNCLDVHLMDLRRCLGEELGDTREGLIETVKRFGYRIRGAASGEAPESAHLIADGRVAVDPEEPSIWVDRSRIELARAEYNIARELARRPDRLVGVGTLIRIARGDGVDSTHFSVQNHIKSLRRKIGEGSAEAGDDLGDFRRGAIRTGSRAHPMTYFAVKSLVEA